MPERIRCPTCGQTFGTQREVDDHGKQMHAPKKDEGERESERRVRKGREEPESGDR